jgi:iron complex outermembrane receptor protein
MLKKAMIACLCLSAWTSAQAQYELSGTVMGSDGQVVPFALIRISQTQIQTMSSSDGLYHLSNLQQGRYVITTSCFGYLDQKDTLDINNTFTYSPQLKTSAKQLDEVVVNAGRVDDRNGMVYSNLDANAIQKQNIGQDAPYLLNTLPNVVVNSDAGNGVGYTGMRVRGTDPTRINVTINGVPVNDAESQGTFWVDFPDLASSTNNIQLQRGVGTSANGSGAFGASLNFQTNALKEKAYGQLITTGGSFGTLRNSLMAGTGLINKKFSIDARVSKIVSNGYIDRAASDLNSLYFAAGYYAKKSVIKLIVFTGSEKTYQSWNYVLEDSIKRGNRTYNSCGEYYDADGKLHYYNNETDNYRQDNYQLHFIHNFNSRLNLNVTAHYTKGKGYYEQYKQGQNFADYNVTNLNDASGTPLTQGDLIRRLWLNNDFAGGIFNLYYKANSNLAFTLGGGYNTYYGQHYGEFVRAIAAKGADLNQRYGLNSANKNDGNLYLKTNYRINGKTFLFLDLQARSVGYRFLGFNDSLQAQMQNANYLFVNPKFGLSHDLTNYVNVYASVSRANKEPNRDDFVQSNKTSRPRPEQLTDFEAGAKFKKKTWVANLNFYDMEYKDQLVLNGQINNVGAYNRMNVAASFRRGFELEVQKALGKYFVLGGNLSLSQNKIKNFNEFIDSSDVSGSTYTQYKKTYSLTDISFSPNHVSSLIFLIKPMKGIEITLTQKNVGRQYLDNTSNAGRCIKAYSLLDARINYSIKTKWIPEIGFMVSMHNIFSKKYETNGYTFSYYSGPDLYTYNYLAPAALFNFISGITLKF